MQENSNITEALALYQKGKSENNPVLQTEALLRVAPYDLREFLSDNALTVIAIIDKYSDAEIEAFFHGSLTQVFEGTVVFLGNLYAVTHEEPVSKKPNLLSKLFRRKSN